MTTTLSRIEKQLESLETRRNELASQLAEGEAPLVAAQTQLEEALRARAQIDGELQAARIASDELDAQLRDRSAAGEQAGADCLQESRSGATGDYRFGSGNQVVGLR